MISCAVAAVLGSIHWPWAVKKLVIVRNTISCPFKKIYFSNCQGIKIVTTLYHLIFTVHVTNSVAGISGRNQYKYIYVECRNSLPTQVFYDNWSHCLLSFTSITVLFCRHIPYVVTLYILILSIFVSYRLLLTYMSQE